tara:strand:+ start:145 stop:465 length:321 start_codon:yes stop_codon:yes gene_type:complete
MDKNDSNWSENTDDIAEIKKKIKNEFNEEDHIDDLRDSLASTLENTREIFNNLTTTIDSTIKDEEVKKETKNLINKLNLELSDLIKNSDNLINNIIDKSEITFEEE